MGGLAMNGKRISREFVPLIVDGFLLTTGLDAIPYYICGSYRRRKDDCGDIELVFHMDSSDERLFNLRIAIAKIFGYNLMGNPKMQGLFGGVQFDLFVSGSQGLGAMLLHATGSGLFNIKMRACAKARGLLLNQYGLFRSDVAVVYGKTEEEIFDYLSMKYYSPEERDI